MDPKLCNNAYQHCGHILDGSGARHCGGSSQPLGREATAAPVILPALALWLLAAPAFGQVTVNDTWTDDAFTGVWSTDGNWTKGVPNNTPNTIYNVTIPVAGFNQGPFQDINVTINDLTIDSSAVTVQDGLTLRINGTSIIDDGGLNLAGQSSTLLIGSNVTLSGTGALNMTRASLSGAGTFFNQATIQGSGTIGSGAGPFTLNNSGTVNATDSTFPLAIIPLSSSLVTNTGTLEGTTGLLELTGMYSNAGGKIAGSVHLGGARIVGGSLSSGIISPIQGTPSILNGVTIDLGCQYLLTTSTSTILQGTIINNGQIKLDDSGILKGSTTQLIANSTVTLDGNGAVTTSGSLNNKITGTGELIISGSQTVDSGLTINVNTIINHSVINASGFPIFIQPGTGGFTNTGMLEATSGGTWKINGGTVTNTGGTLLGPGVLSGAVTLDGGVLGETNEGQETTLDSTTNSGEFDIFNGDVTTFKNTFINNGTVNMTAVNCSNPCSNATAQVSGNVTVSGTGTWDLKSVPGFTTEFSGATGSDTLTNSSTIQGAGNIGNNSMNFINAGKGVIEANMGLPFTISTGSGHVFRNMGLVSVAANPGSAPSMLTIAGKFGNFSPITLTLTGGKYLIDGTLQFDNANIVTNAANLTLAGQIVNQNNVNALLNFAHNAATGSLTILPQTFGANFTSAGPYGNAGKVIISEGVTWLVVGGSTNYNQTGGTTTVDGTLAVSTGVVNATGGTLQGAGTISGNVSVGNASGTVATLIVGDSTKKAGLLSVSNNYSQLATGVMDVQIGGTTVGTQYSQLNATGTATLNGTLNIKLTNKFKPTLGQTFTILNASSGITGTFSAVNGTSINANEHFSVSYTGSTVVLTVVPGA